MKPFSSLKQHERSFNFLYKSTLDVFFAFFLVLRNCLVGHTPLTGALLGDFIFSGTLRFWCEAFLVLSKSGHFWMRRL